MNPALSLRGLAAALVLATLAACGGGSGSPSNPAATPAEAASPVLSCAP